MMLFEKINIGSLELPNRLVYPPMGTNLADKEGFVTDKQIKYYARRAEGGCGLIQVEFAAVAKDRYAAKEQIRISDDKYLPGLTALASAIKEQGAKACIQIHHPGRQNYAAVTGLQPVAPSPIPCPKIQEMPKELTVAEIEDLIEWFAEAGLRAKKAGFDCVELHGAHGYLICQFLSPFSNKRTDAYGGDVPRRSKFALEIIKGIKAKVGKDFPVILRFSGDEHVPGGIDIEQAKEIARLAENAGADAVHISAGNYAAMQWVTQPMFMPRGCLVPLAAAVRKEVKVPVITVGRIGDAALAEKILQEGSADLIAMGRPLLADPDLPKKALHGKADQTKHCIACNTCMDRVLRMVDITCLVNTEAAREGLPEQTAAVSKKVLIVGGGPAGLEAARVAGLRGHEVTIWDEREKLGGRWAWLVSGCIKQRTDDLKQMGVTIELGRSVNRAAIDGFRPDVVLVTRQATPIMPSLPGIGQAKVLLADDVLDLNIDAGKSVAILGGGNAGCEVAEQLRKTEAAATIIESSDRMAMGLEGITRTVLLQRLTEHNVQLWTGTQIHEIDGRTLIATDKQGNERRLEVDSIVVALGYKAKDDLLAALEGADFAVRPLPFCEVARKAGDTMLEGGRIAREI